FLKPVDAAGAAAVAAAARDGAPVLALLAGVTAAGALVIRRAVQGGAWRRIVLVVAGLAVGWTAFFGTWVHPGIGRTQSLQAFMVRVDALVPADVTVGVTFPPDPGLRFYAPRPLEPWRPAAPS